MERDVKTSSIRTLVQKGVPTGLLAGACCSWMPCAAASLTEEGLSLNEPEAHARAEEDAALRPCAVLVRLEYGDVRLFFDSYKHTDMGGLKDDFRKLSEEAANKQGKSGVKTK